VLKVHKVQLDIQELKVLEEAKEELDQQDLKVIQVHKVT
jgi:hypothetical protein